MKIVFKVLWVLFLIFINFVAFVFSAFAIPELLSYPGHINKWLTLLYIFFCFYAIIFVIYKGVYGNKFLARFGVGLVSLALSLTYLGLDKTVDFIENKFATTGEYYPFEIKKAYENVSIDVSDFVYLRYGNRLYIDFEPNEITEIDSLHLRIDTSFYGNFIISKDNYKVMESQNCNHEDIDTLDYYNSNMRIADELYFKRCFSGAIDHYTRALRSDSLNINNEYIYFQRGMLRLFYKEYDNAYYDFVLSFLFFYARVDYESLSEKIEFSEGDKMGIIQNLIEGFTHGKIDENIDLSDVIQTISNVYHYQKYNYLLNFCTKNRNRKRMFEIK